MFKFKKTLKGMQRTVKKLNPVRVLARKPKGSGTPSVPGGYQGGLFGAANRMRR
jgi:hypothetical protein